MFALAQWKEDGFGALSTWVHRCSHRDITAAWLMSTSVNAKDWDGHIVISATDLTVYSLESKVSQTLSGGVMAENGHLRCMQLGSSVFLSIGEALFL